MSVNSKHPDLTASRADEWRKLRDTMDGDRAVKEAGERYLPMPSGFRSMPDGGGAAYNDAYKRRAIVPEILAPSIAAMIGIIHAKETQIAMPDSMARLWENADGNGTPLEAFHRRITRHLLWLGRFGVLTTAPASGGEPFLVGYSGDAVINWDRDFYVLDESGMVRDGFDWSFAPRFRVLELREGVYVSTIYEGKTLATITETVPQARGGAALDFVPFAVGNARDISPALETPPLIGVANAIINAYQLSADWRWQLYMSGQETLVAVNVDETPTQVGAGAIITIKGDQDAQPDLKYVGPSCKGIEAHERAIQKQHDAAVMAGARMFERSQGQESGEARRLRFASETANLMSVAQVSAGLLERGLRAAGRMMGMDDVSEIVVTPPRDLLDNTMGAQEFAQLFSVYTQGGMSWETFYERGQSGGIFSTERDAQQEYALIDNPGVMTTDPVA